jgi:hypothetical protein
VEAGEIKSGHQIDLVDKVATFSVHTDHIRAFSGQTGSSVLTTPKSTLHWHYLDVFLRRD